MSVIAPKNREEGERGRMGMDIFPNCDERIARTGGMKRFVFKAFPALPRHVYLPFLHELRMTWRRVGTGQATRKFRDARGLRVNVGCGPCGKAGWTNIDIDDFPGVDCFWDCRKSLPFPDHSVKCIFTEHFVEHLDYNEEIPRFISDCHRVLEPGGVIRIIVPDGAKYMRGYSQGGWEELAKIRPLRDGLTDAHFGSKYNTRMELVNVVFRQYFEHKFAWDYETMEFVLRKFGFSKTYLQAFGKSMMDGLAIDMPERASESLYVEGVK